MEATETDICNVIAISIGVRVTFFMPVEASFIVRFMAPSDQFPGHKAYRTISGYVPDISEAKIGKNKTTFSVGKADAFVSDPRSLLESG